MDKILILLLGLLAVCVAFLVFAYNQKDKLAEKKVKEGFSGIASGQPCGSDSQCESRICDNGTCRVAGEEHYQGQCNESNPCGEGQSCNNGFCQEDFEGLDCSGCDTGGTCDVGCSEQENYQGYREHFDAANGAGCDEDDDCASNYCNNADPRVCRPSSERPGEEHYQGYRENFACEDPCPTATPHCNTATNINACTQCTKNSHCDEDETCVNGSCVGSSEHYQGYREHYTTCETNDDCGSGSCVNGSCQEEHFTSNNCDDCPGKPDCGNRGCPTSENFCGTGSCFQEGFRSGGFNGSYKKPAGQEFFQGYGIESFINGGNYSQFDEHFEEEGGDEGEHYENYQNNIREDFQSEPATFKLFYADWCGHCKRFKPTFENELPQVIRSRGLGCKLVAINADEQPDLVRRYNVKGFPTMILEKNGRLIEYNGDRTVSDIERFISKNL
jgi:thiol-disulfide isomerase/thioredoxin